MGGTYDNPHIQKVTAQIQKVAAEIQKVTTRIQKVTAFIRSRLRDQFFRARSSRMLGSLLVK